MATLIIVALRGCARCVMTRRRPLPALGTPLVHFQQVLPMFPVNSVTYLPGCSLSHASLILRLFRRTLYGLETGNAQETALANRQKFADRCRQMTNRTAC